MAAKGQLRSSVRVAVVDDDADMRGLVRDIVQGADDFSYAGSFSNASEALNGLPLMRPDLVLMDIRMPGLNGIECLRRLKAAMPGLKVVMLRIKRGFAFTTCSWRCRAIASSTAQTSGVSI